jgi:hypothetical protein
VVERAGRRETDPVTVTTEPAAVPAPVDPGHTQRLAAEVVAQLRALPSVTPAAPPMRPRATRSKKPPETP